MPTPCLHESCRVNQIYNILSTVARKTKNVVGFWNMCQNPTTVVSTIKMLEWRVVYDLCLTWAVRATKVAYDSRKQKSYRLHRPFFALNVSAHPYCARNPLRDVLPRHALERARCWRNVDIYSSSGHFNMHGFNSLKCSVTPYFLLIDHFLCRLSTFCEKLKKICIVEVWFFFNFSTLASSNFAIIVAARSS